MRSCKGKGKKKREGEEGSQGSGKKRERGRGEPVPKLWLGEWTVVSDHPTSHFGNSFFVSRADQARYITAAYAMVSKLKYVKALGWFTLLDQPESPDSADWGLMQASGVPKPCFAAYEAVP